MAGVFYYSYLNTIFHVGKYMLFIVRIFLFTVFLFLNFGLATENKIKQKENDFNRKKIEFEQTFGIIIPLYVYNIC